MAVGCFYSASLKEKCWPMVKILSYMPGTRGKCCRVKVLMNDEATIRFLLMAPAPISNACARSSRTESHSAFWPYCLHGNSVYICLCREVIKRLICKTRFSSHIIWSIYFLTMLRKLQGQTVHIEATNALGSLKIHL